jgi:UDP-glucose:glycoprotein glucosyltransferase
VPVDLSRGAGAKLVVETIQTLIKRKVPFRWGVIPSTASPDGISQAKVIYHLQESYGLIAVIGYLEQLLATKADKLKPDETIFNNIVEERTLKADKIKLTLEEIEGNQELADRISKTTQYLKRLGAHGVDAPLFVNGVAVKQEDEWLQTLSQQASIDLRAIQQALFEERIDNDYYLPDLFLNGSSLRRNPLVIPSNDKEVTLVNLPSVLGEDGKTLAKLPHIKHKSTIKDEEAVVLLVIADFGTKQGLNLMNDALHLTGIQDKVELIFVPNPGSESIAKKTWSALEQQHFNKGIHDELEANVKAIEALLSLPEVNKDSIPAREQVGLNMSTFIANLKIKPGEIGVLLNGRLVGPIPEDVEFGQDDISMLIEYEERKRNGPATTAISQLGVTDKVTSMVDFAKLRSLLAVSQVSDLPEGIFESPPLVRVNFFYEWADKYTSFTVGDNSTAVIQLVAVLDPASEVAQKWTPLLNALSKLDGISLKVFLNPKPTLEELPVKRFYRYVLDHDPSFNADGSVRGSAAEFLGIPSKALLNMGMDIPAAWLVSSKNSIHDLDNIKLSTLGPNTNVEATYELESILIEGHSRDVSNEGAPSGAQLVLSTGENTQVADTIIMSNLGYFQFKANPGYYSISLKQGPSSDIFNIDSVGALGYSPHPGDEATDVTVLSFQGTTLYPRVSRKPGRELDNVLQATVANSDDLIKQGASFVGSWLEKAGLKKEVKQAAKHADINIFSVASGHLYERMLNIMMVSVMRHTNQTVKFWFIEQFLSPSFKEFVPTLAKEYGFQYEMVTYKWPHWLRAQKEKQREIWGYKILFLDVLFPLDLDKVIFVDADQIVRTDMMNLINEDLNGAPYGFTPMCDSRTEMEGFRFWKQGYWKNYLRGLPYHISALYVVDLKRFRQMAAGDSLRTQYHQLSADPNSLSNLDQDLPNNMQNMIPIHSLDQNWLWCETWCSDEALAEARTIDLCNNPQTKEPKLERARRQVPEWTVYDDEIAALARRSKTGGAQIPLGQVQEDDLFGKSETVVEEMDAKPSDKDEL